MFYQILLSPQVKRREIISDKYGIYKLPNEVPNNLRLMARSREDLENLNLFFHKTYGHLTWQGADMVTR